MQSAILNLAKKAFIINAALGILFSPKSLLAHNPLMSASTSLQSIFTGKGYAGMSADLNLSFSLFSFGLDFQGINFPEHYDQPQSRIVNTAVGFSIMRYFAVEYVSGGYWRTTGNLPLMRASELFSGYRDNQGTGFFGLLIAIDWPISGDRETRYRFGLSFNTVSHYPRRDIN